MLLCDTTTKSVEFILDAVVTTIQLPFVVAWADRAIADWRRKGLNTADGLSNSLTAVTLVPAPAAGNVREVIYLSIMNNDTVAAGVRLRFNDNGVLRIIWHGTLQVQDTFFYDQDRGFYVLDSQGRLKTSATGGPTAYGPVDFTNVGSVTVLGTTHGLGSSHLLPVFKDTSAPRQVINNVDWTIDDTTFNFVATFVGNLSGRLELFKLF